MITINDDMDRRDRRTAGLLRLGIVAFILGFWGGLGGVIVWLTWPRLPDLLARSEEVLTHGGY